MTDEVTIRPIKKDEFSAVKDFPPPDWNTNLAEFLEMYFGQSYFYSIVAVFENDIVGFANTVSTGNAAWLGNIIVRPDFRGKKIGTMLTQNLIDHLKFNNCESQLLIATDMGEPVYRKLGFRTTANYPYLKGPKLTHFNFMDDIKDMTDEDLNGVIELDKIVTGECREHLIRKFQAKGKITKNGQKVTGYYLPSFAKGLVIADNHEDGLKLLGYKHFISDQSTSMPMENKAALEFLTSNGYTITKTLPRMVLGKEVNWKPELVFSRASGYCG